MTTHTEPPRNMIIPLDIASIIMEKYDSNLTILDESSQIYGKALDGKGSILYKNGNTYEGEFFNGMLHGKGTFTWSNGVKYIGQFNYNQITGKGKYIWPDESWFEGDVRQGLRHGEGTYCTPTNESTYTGQWKGGLRDGKGVMKFKSGAIYEGQFKDGMKDGQGKMTYPSGNYYEGEWSLDKKEGEGVMFWMTAGEKYTGKWVDNKQNGFGVHIWLEPKGDGKYLRNRYEGQWKEGVRHGYGVFYYSNGSKYEGEWANNLKEGFAIFTYDDGRVFKGYFRSDKMQHVEGTGASPIKSTSRTEYAQFLNEEGTKLAHNNSSSHITVRPDQTGANLKLDKKGTVRPDPKSDAKKALQRNTSMEKTSHSAFKRLDANDKENPKKDVAELENNPYEYMTDVYDLLTNEPESASIVKEIQNLLLRYHSHLKKWYRLYSSKQHDDMEESFALSMKMFWKMLRDCSILSSKITIASFNRIFLQGRKNIFELHSSLEVMNIKIRRARKEMANLHLSDISEAPNESTVSIDNIQEILREKPDDVVLHEVVTLLTKHQIDVHDETRILLFRHFVDALVRVAYLKYGGSKNFAKNVEKVFVNRIINTFETKKRRSISTEEEHLLHKVRPVFEHYKTELKKIFQIHSAKRQQGIFQQIDYTFSVKKLIDLFKKAKFVNSEMDKQQLLRITEVFYDPDETFTTPENIKEKDKKQLSKEEKVARLYRLLESEIILLEFIDIFALYVFKRLETVPSKDSEIKNYIKSMITRFIQSTNEEELQIKDTIIWPYSEKDHMVKNLKQEKEKREKELEVLRRKKIERDNEDREYKLMKKEDFDISDKFVQKKAESEEEEEDDQSSYDDF